MRRGWLCLVVCLACRSGDRKQPSASPPVARADAAPADATSSIDVRFGDKRIAVEHAFIKRRPDHRLSLYLGDGGSCALHRANLYGGQDYVIVELATLLGPDGRETLHATRASGGPDNASESVQGTATLEGDLGSSALDLDLTGADGKLAVHGRLAPGQIESCGDDHDPAPPMKVDHPSTATMTIAGRELPIRSARLIQAMIFRGEPERTLVLDDIPIGCQGGMYTDVRLSFARGDWILDGASRRAPCRVARASPCDSVPPDEASTARRSSWHYREPPGSVTIRSRSQERSKQSTASSAPACPADRVDYRGSSEEPC